MPLLSHHPAQLVADAADSGARKKAERTRAARARTRAEAVQAEGAGTVVTAAARQIIGAEITITATIVDVGRLN